MSVIERAVVSGMQALKILDIFGSDVFQGFSALFLHKIRRSSNVP
jgi:hypothetical protein